MARILSSAAICVLLSSPSFAEFYTGNDLLHLCSDGGEGVCLGYIMGVADTMEGGATTIFGIRACVPNRATGKQLEDTVVAHLKRHVAARHLAANVLVAGALAVTFPCP
jgi:hypothetical protein